MVVTAFGAIVWLALFFTLASLIPKLEVPWQIPMVLVLLALLIGRLL